MPELPEVETVKNVLKPHLIGRTITAVTINNRSVIARSAAEEFAARLHGQVFTDFTRQGKFLTLHFKSGDSVVLHLRMTGCLTIEPQNAPCEKHTHVMLALDDGNELRFEDMRRFSRFWLVENGLPDTFSGKYKLGIKPFEIAFDYLKAKFGTSKKALKALLLDQSIVAGIGNIYSDEICFAAKILPDRAGNTLTDDEMTRLCEIIPERLTYFIGKNEISFEEYAQTKGKDYRNTPYLQVYGNQEKPCPLCGKPLIGKAIGGRSSVYCPSCQK